MTVTAEDPVEVALAQQRPVYRAPGIDALTVTLLTPFAELEAAIRQLLAYREQGLRGSGYALDLAGGIVSLQRRGLGDDDYRLALATRVASLNSSGAPENLISVLRSVIARDPVQGSVVRVRRGQAHVELEISPAPGLAPAIDWVRSPVEGAALDAVDGSHSAGDTTLSLLAGTLPGAGCLSIHGGAYDGAQVFTYNLTAPSLAVISPALPLELAGGEELRLVGLDRRALGYLRGVLLSAVSAEAEVQVASGPVGLARAFALASAVHLTAAAAVGATALASSPQATAGIPSAGWCQPAGSPVTRYRVSTPGALTLDSGLGAAVNIGDLVRITDSAGADAAPGSGLGVGVLYGVVGS